MMLRTDTGKRKTTRACGEGYKKVVKLIVVDLRKTQK